MDWMQFVDQSGLPTAVKTLVGNKIDEPEENRQVSTEQGRALATALGLSFFETSAKESNNVEAAFRCLVGEIMEYLILNNQLSPSVSSSACRLHLPTRRPSNYNNDYYCRNRNGDDENESCIC